MHYNQYQRLINIVGGLYENHPGYFDDLTAEERQVLSRVFFYDYDYDSEDCPDDFPESFPDFFRDRIAGNQALQDEALAAVAKRLFFFCPTNTIVGAAHLASFVDIHTSSLLLPSG